VNTIMIRDVIVAQMTVVLVSAGRHFAVA